MLWHAVVLFLAAGFLCGQDRVVSTRIFTEPSGAAFTVDGEKYLGTATFFWPEGSKHLVVLLPHQETGTGSRLSYVEWRNSSDVKISEGFSAIISADASVPWYKAVGKIEYAISLELRGSAPLSCAPGPAAGKVYILDGCYSQSTVLWVRANSTVTLQAYPPPGYAFAGWNASTPVGTGFIVSFLATRAIDFEPRFEPATPVTLRTIPPGLRVFADRSEVSTPASYDWLATSRHTIGAVSPQSGANDVWVFDSWSDGGTQHHDVTVPPGPTPVSLTATFVPGVRNGLTTIPPGLKLEVDGSTNWPGYNFIWASGSKHTISAPAEQNGPDGRRYRFRSWSNGGPAFQEVSAATGASWAAVYDALATLTLTSNPSGIALTVDGTECRTPCTVYRPEGTDVLVEAPPTLPSTADNRLAFTGWPDSGPPSRTVRMTAAGTALTATYQSAWHLEVLAEPAAAASFRLEPAAAEGYYAVGTRVRVVALPKPGYAFRMWEGPVEGISASAVVTMSSPVTIRAVLDPGAWIAPGGIRNAAGEPENSPGVAAGSIISIYGANLAPQAQAGPLNPLAQSIAAVTLTAGPHLLPLFFVSPEQINAQLPAGIKPGDYVLTVRPPGVPAATQSFTVVEAAPGVFNTAERLAVASHQDGTAVNAENPARAGETVTVFGTGFGPYWPSPPDGFPVPAEPLYSTAFQAEVIIMGAAALPAHAYAAPGQTGVTAVQFKVPEAPAGPALEFSARVRGRESNSVCLPIEKSGN